MSLKVLYVEDNTQHQKHSLELFQKFFKKIDIASNGKEGLDLYLKYYETNNTYYDIVISDMEMPLMNGIDMTKAIYEENKEQIIVIISAYNNPNYLIKFINVGIYYFILKPYNINDIVDVFNKIKTKLDKNKNLQISADLFYSSSKMSVTYKNQHIPLTKKEHLLLDLLTKNIDNIISYEIIYYTLWGAETSKGNPKILNPMISKLKKKLKKDNIIQNIYGIGYKISSYNA